MQFQADILSCKVIRPHITETTALGAAFFAGLAIEYWENISELKSIFSIDRCFTPQCDQNKAKQGWVDAISRTLNK